MAWYLMSGGYVQCTYAYVGCVNNGRACPPVGFNEAIMSVATILPVEEIRIMQDFESPIAPLMERCLIQRSD